MQTTAGGVNPAGSLLGGLRTKGNVGAYAKGMASQSAAGLGMAREQSNQEIGTQAMQQESQQRQQQNSNQAQRAGNEVQETLAGQAFRNRQNVFNTNMDYNYAQQLKQRQVGYMQTLLNNLVRE